MAKNPKIHTVTCKYDFAVDGGGATGTTTALADTGFIPKGAQVLRVGGVTNTALAGSGGGLELYAEGTDGSGSALLAKFAAGTFAADGDAETSVVTNSIIGEESDFAIKMVTAVASAGEITFVIEYIN